MNHSNGIELAPCVVSKAKFALRIKTRQPHNRKPFSEAYWNRVIDTIVQNHNANISEETIEEAKRMYLHYRNSLNN